MNTRKIDKAFFGRTSVTRIYQGRRLVWPITGVDMPLEYISNGTGQHPDPFYNSPDVYYDTGVVPSLNTKVEIMYEWPKLYSNSALFGVGDYLKYGDSINATQDKSTFYFYNPGAWRDINIPEPRAWWGCESYSIRSSRELYLPGVSFNTPHTFIL